jgi:hypothetical protein
MKNRRKREAGAAHNWDKLMLEFWCYGGESSHGRRKDNRGRRCFEHNREWLGTADAI